MTERQGCERIEFERKYPESKEKKEMGKNDKSKEILERMMKRKQKDSKK